MNLGKSKGSLMQFTVNLGHCHSWFIGRIIGNRFVCICVMCGEGPFS